MPCKKSGLEQMNKLVPIENFPIYLLLRKYFYKISFFLGLFCTTPGIPLARAVPKKVSSYMLLTGKPIRYHPYITSAKGLCGWVQKMADFADLQSEILPEMEVT